MGAGLNRELMGVVRGAGACGRDNIGHSIIAR